MITHVIGIALVGGMIGGIIGNIVGLRMAYILFQDGIFNYIKKTINVTRPSHIPSDPVQNCLHEWGREYLTHDHIESPHVLMSCSECGLLKVEIDEKDTPT